MRDNRHWSVMELTFSIDQYPKRRWRRCGAVFRWIRGFVLHDAGLALKPAPFSVQVRAEKGDLVKGFPADSRERAEALLERLKAQCASLGVHDFLVKHDAPTHFVTRAARSS